MDWVPQVNKGIPVLKDKMVYQQFFKELETAVEIMMHLAVMAEVGVMAVMAVVGVMALMAY